MIETNPHGQMADAAVTAASVPILELRGLEKRYGATHALKPADLSFVRGEVSRHRRRKWRRQIDNSSSF